MTIIGISLKEGRSGITSVTRFDASDIASQGSFRVTDFNPEDFMDPKKFVGMTDILSLLLQLPSMR